MAHPQCECVEHIPCPCDGKNCTLCFHDPRHGSYNGYQNLRCRCESCRAANAVYMAGAKQRRMQRGIPEHLHGTIGGYHNWGCKCPPCTKAATLDTTDRRHRAKLGLTRVGLGLMAKPTRRNLNRQEAKP